jgi:hypothetical protein
VAVEQQGVWYVGRSAAFWWRIGIVLAGAFGLSFRNFSLVYFTVQSNLIVFAYYIGVLYWMCVRKTEEAAAPRLRDAMTYWIVITGLVSHVILEHGANPLPGLVSGDNLFDEWAVFAVHYIVPLMVLVDWLLFQPRRPSSWSMVLRWMSYPLFYAVLVLARAAIYPDFPIAYPYFFLDPRENGYLWVFGQLLQLTAEFAVLGVIFGLLSRWRTRIGQGSDEVSPAP